MIIGAHAIIYSRDPEADRAFFRDVLKFPHADAGGGWLIFGLPPSEVAVHPSDENDRHELCLMCDDVRGFIRDMENRGMKCSDVHQQPWGLLTEVVCPAEESSACISRGMRGRRCSDALQRVGWQP